MKLSTVQHHLQSGLELKENNCSYHLKYTDKLSITGSTVKKFPDQLARSNFKPESLKQNHLERKYRFFCLQINSTWPANLLFSHHSSPTTLIPVTSLRKKSLQLSSGKYSSLGKLPSSFGNVQTAFRTLGGKGRPRKTTLYPNIMLA